MTLNDGRSIDLKALYQEMTYGGLLEGTPDAKSNKTALKHLVKRAQNEFAHPTHKPYLIDPPRRDYLRDPGDMDSLSFKWQKPEWMPSIACIGQFESVAPARDESKHASTLTIVWLQSDYAMPIAPECVEAIRSIDWVKHAIDFIY
ncbi:MAG: hypothetical protein AAF585_17625 [Verrucomicrobiota bacterium]